MSSYAHERPALCILILLIWIGNMVIPQLLRGLICIYARGWLHLGASTGRVSIFESSWFANFHSSDIPDISLASIYTYDIS
jgi:hypothetical protein